MWEKRPKKLFGLAGITKGQGNAVSHRLRDTFGVALLLAGVPIERLSVLLGHQSVRVTEKHYNPWVRSRQEQLEADVARAWKLDPVLKTKNFGINQVHFSEGVGELNENKGAKLEARVGIEPATTLRRQKLLILLNGKNAKNTAIAQVRYTAGTPVRTQ